MANAVEKIREFRAEAKFQRTSPQKAKLVLDLIKGLRVEQALNTVHFSTKRMAPVVEKVLRSAIQNATYVSQEQGLDVDVDNLYVRTAVANEGPRMKRIRPAPMGRAFRYQRRLAHIIVTVAEKKPRHCHQRSCRANSSPGREEDHEEGSDQDCGKTRSQEGRRKEDSRQEDCSQKGREVSSFL